ncbi:aminotransferase class I/II-fold pyridoxal phosphate-dependent enzyme [Saprospiraceae bacterium]|nr:aminotransferase class I/II-fold pyridoxal phosphate-dependent enzyme [Saprospiraceae bacterium]
MDKKTKMRFSTICARENHNIENGSPHILPLHASSAFSFSNLDASIEIFSGQKEGFVYSRFGNPTVTSVQNKLAALETIDLDQEGFCVLTASGMAAISTLASSQLKSGEALLTSTNLYGGTSEVFSKVLSRNGVDIIYVDFKDEVAITNAITTNPNIKLIYFETPSNPVLSCLDIKMIISKAKANNILTAIDNTFATCYIQRPLTMGVDFVIYSTTKFLNGHGNSIAGAIIGKSEELRHNIWTHMKLLGTNCSPFEAWLVHNGLKTLPLRMDKHCHNAMELSQYLEKHSKIKKVNYPGLDKFPDHNIAKKQMSKYGGMLSFEIDGDINDAKKFMNNTKLCSITSTLGNTDTLLLHPATSSHLNIDPEVRLANGISDSLVRVSVGIEDINDLIEDFELGLL